MTAAMPVLPYDGTNLINDVPDNIKVSALDHIYTVVRLIHTDCGKCDGISADFLRELVNNCWSSTPGSSLS
jgi:hypothetical protein